MIGERGKSLAEGGPGGAEAPAPVSSPLDRRADHGMDRDFWRLKVRDDLLLETYGGFFPVACAVRTLWKVSK